MYRVGHTIGYLAATIVLQEINALIVVAVHVAVKIIKLKHKGKVKMTIKERYFIKVNTEYLSDVSEQVGDEVEIETTYNFEDAAPLDKDEVIPAVKHLRKELPNMAEFNAVKITIVEEVLEV
ncbi:MAG: hypothetical protein ACRCWQ_03015 [Bacilli bacterium]